MTGAGAALVAGIAARPGDSGGAYSEYFARLNRTLRRLQIGTPTLVIDLDRLDRNIERVRWSIGAPPLKRYRVVDKSLPSLPLLDYVSMKAGTNAFMSFHLPFLSALVNDRPDADVLLGKPMPIDAARRFYRDLRSGFEPARQLRWLIDSHPRLLQYQSLARGLGATLQVSLEIDVGLHRGGFAPDGSFVAALKTIAEDPEHLRFSGFMGYDAQVAELPGILADREATAVRARYESFVAVVHQHYPALLSEPVTFNGAGSMTFRNYEGQSVLNDVSAGSCLLKPAHFDLPSLEKFEPAAFIATPVLKRLTHTRLPELEWASALIESWDPNRAQTYFLYGGNWLAQFESPPGLIPVGPYTSSNQQGVSASSSVSIDVDDFVFLRPMQSEAVLLQFGDLLVLRGETLVDRWPVLEAHQ
jgi:D-serine deaminase-like pyridoxal phosphate-dependent protein